MFRGVIDRRVFYVFTRRTAALTENGSIEISLLAYKQIDFISKCNLRGRLLLLVNFMLSSFSGQNIVMASINVNYLFGHVKGIVLLGFGLLLLLCLILSTDHNGQLFYT